MGYPSTPRANDAPIVDALSCFSATWKLSLMIMILLIWLLGMQAA